MSASTCAVRALVVGSSLLAAGLGQGAEQPKPGGARQARTDLHGDPLPAGAIARLGTVRFRPPAGAHWLAFSPGDKTLLTAGGRLSAWDVATGKEVRRFRFGGWGGCCSALAPNGKTLATGTQTNVIYL